MVFKYNTLLLINVLKGLCSDSLDDFVINRELTDYLKRNKGILNTIIYGANGGKIYISTNDG